MTLTPRFGRMVWIIFPLLSACSALNGKSSPTPVPALPPAAKTTPLNQAALQSKYDDNPDNLLNTLDPEVTSIDKAFEKAQLAQVEGRIDRALFYYVKALQFEPHNTQILEQIAAIHEQNNKPELALKIYQDILKLDKNNVVANESLGLNYLNNHLQAEAKQHLKLAIAQDDSRWLAHNGLGVIADLNKEYPAAIAHYQKALASNPNSPMLLTNIGYSYYLKGDNKSAKNYFNQALSFDSQYIRAIQNEALIEIKNQQYAAAVALFNRVMKPYESYNNVGYICMLNGNYETAENYFRQAIDESPLYFSKAQENLEQLKFLRSNE